ncbi:MAG: sodium-dependent bicarbonate transport family permease [Betaproteobacteria bacterium]|nr:sodium-dependent bicarbonate transport family permease [Betaproteobacteria bacterium]
MQNLLDPAILFFVFGVIAGTIRSNLEIPPAISRFLSLYLLMALGLKGGFALSHSGLNAAVAASLGAAVFLAISIPIAGYLLLRKLVSGFDAAAIAATYGSVSAVTFLTATQYLDNQSIPYGGHMAAAMALMESPAIIFAVLLANRIRSHAQTDKPSGTPSSKPPRKSTDTPTEAQTVSVRKVLHESFTDGAQLLLLGAMIVGLISGEAGERSMQPFAVGLFKGMLSFFLLDMGLMAARSFSQASTKPPLLVVYAVLAPAIHAALALGLALLLQLPAGDAALLMTLAASASYIAVPAVLRIALPEANPSLYFGLSLGVTFPLNILFGIPIYTAAAQKMLGN